MMSTSHRFGIAEMIIPAFLFYLVLFTGMSGCRYHVANYSHDTTRVIKHTSTDDIDPLLTRTRVEKSYCSGVAAIKQEPDLTVGEVWVLNEILKSKPDETLQQIVNDKSTALAGHPYLRLIDPNAPLVKLPENSETGLNRFCNYVLAPFGFPRERAMSFINDFLATEETGYVLTHQFMVLIWAEQTGLELPGQVIEKKQKLLEKILQEQSTDNEFSDLYAERVAILLHFGTQKSSDAARWIQMTVNAQLQNGSWGFFSGELTFAGQSISGKPGVSHTIALSLLSLRNYLDKY